MAARSITRYWRWTLGASCLAGLVLLLSFTVISRAQERRGDEPKASRSSSEESGTSSETAPADRIRELERKMARLERTIDDQNKRLDEMGQNDATRVAVINMPKVIKEYKKTVAQEDAIRAVAKSYATSLKALSERIQTMQENPPQEELKKPAWQNDLKKLERELTIRTEERNAAMQQQSGEAIRVLYKDIETAAETVARNQRLDVVFYYNDSPDPSSHFNPDVLRARISGSGPIYTAPGRDITEDVVKVLNKDYTAAETGEESDR